MNAGVAFHGAEQVQVKTVTHYSDLLFDNVSSLIAMPH